MEPNKSNSETIRNVITQVLDSGSSAVLVTLIESEDLPVGAKLLVKESYERSGDLGDETLNDYAAQAALRFLETREETKALRGSEFTAEAAEKIRNSVVLFERIEAEPQLVIAGAGHVGASLARLAALVGYRVTLIDDRAEFVVRALFSGRNESDVNLIAANSWIDSMRAAIGNGRGVSVAIVTRGHKQDEDCLRAAISASPDYIGMIGSKRRTNIVLDKLRAEGFESDKLKTVRAPIGLDIGAVSPEEVALAILAEIIAERRGGSGAPLSKWRRP